MSKKIRRIGRVLGGTFLLVLLWVSMQSITVKADEYPYLKPTNLHQTVAKKDAVTVTWDKVQGEHIVYTAYYSLDGTNWTLWLSRQTLNECYLRNLPAGTSKAYFKVFAEDIAMKSGDVTKKGPMSEVCTAVTLPDDLNGLTEASATSSSLTLQWQPSARATSYNIYQYVGGGNPALLGTTTDTTFTVNGLKDASYYQLEVCPVVTNDAFTGLGAKASITAAYTLPGPMTEVKAISYNPSKRSVKLTGWLTEYVKDYQVGVFNLNGKLLKTITKLNNVNSRMYPVISKLNKGQFYVFRLRAGIRSGENIYYGDWSAPVYFGNGPKKITIKKVQKKKAIKVSFSKVSQAKNYTIYISKKSNKGFKKVAVTKKTSYMIKKFGKKKLNKKQNYYVRVIANSKISNVKSVAVSVRAK